MPRILVIDDDRLLAPVLADELRIAGYEADVAYTYTQAIRALKVDHYDAVSLDIMLSIPPDEDVDRDAAAYGRHTGLLIYDHIAKTYPGLPVVVLSVLAADPGESAVLRQRVGFRTSILRKPIGIREYVNEIKTALILTNS